LDGGFLEHGVEERFGGVERQAFEAWYDELGREYEKQKTALTVVCSSACGGIFIGGKVEVAICIQGENSVGRLNSLNKVPIRCVEIDVRSIFVANPIPRYVHRRESLGAE
jgi:hypothetical protein